MATQETYSKTDFVSSLGHSQRTATANGSEVDLVGFESAQVLIDVSAYTDGTHTFDIQEAPDDGTGSSGTFNDVSDSDLLFDTDTAQINNNGQLVIDASGDTGQYQFGYIGQERFLRVVTSSVTGTTTGATYGANVLKGHPRRAPTNDVKRS